jgi:pimeloyl-ACP methyl ester carboxylesterase
MKSVVSNGVSIAFDDQGRGEPALLFLPGWCSPRTVFEDLVPFCAERRRTLALDWPGHGDSGQAPSDLGTEGLIEDALAVIGASGAHSVVPVALSHAGWIAMELRKRLAARVPRVVFLDWIVSEPPPPFREALQLGNLLGSEEPPAQLLALQHL